MTRSWRLDDERIFDEIMDGHNLFILTLVITLPKVSFTDKAKPAARRGRKATGLLEGRRR